MEKDLAGTLVHLIQAINRSFHRELLHKKKSCCMNLHQIFALALLQERTNMIMKDFAHEMFIAAPSATTFVDRLVKLGWVKRMFDKKNRKLVRIAITTSGRRILEKKQKEASALMTQLITHAIPTTDQQHLLGILRRLLVEIHVVASQVA